MRKQLTIQFCDFQLVVRVYDSKYPKNYAEQTLQVFVNVNPGNPVFQPSSSYIVQVNETVSPGHIVQTVLATDQDGVCDHCCLDF